MDAATVRARLQAEGIACRVGRDGVLVASLMRPSGEVKSLWLKDRISRFPGTKVLLSRDRAASDPYFEHSEVFFRVGPAPDGGFAPGFNTKSFTTEVPHEVAAGDRAEVPPAHMCDSPGRRPGSFEGPGRVSPGALVGRERGRAA